jgi:hypothetical protein
MKFRRVAPSTSLATILDDEFLEAYVHGVVIDYCDGRYLFTKGHSTRYTGVHGKALSPKAGVHLLIHCACRERKWMISDPSPETRLIPLHHVWYGARTRHGHHDHDRRLAIPRSVMVVQVVQVA